MDRTKKKATPHKLARERLLIVRAQRRLIQFELIERGVLLILTVAFAVVALVALLAGAPVAAGASVGSGAVAAFALVRRSRDSEHERS